MTSDRVFMMRPKMSSSEDAGREASDAMGSK
jgi:hypothetical protein